MPAIGRTRRSAPPLAGTSPHTWPLLGLAGSWRRLLNRWLRPDRALRRRLSQALLDGLSPLDRRDAGELSAPLEQLVAVGLAFGLAASAAAVSEGGLALFLGMRLGGLGG